MSTEIDPLVMRVAEQICRLADDARDKSMEFDSDDFARLIQDAIPVGEVRAVLRPFAKYSKSRRAMPLRGAGKIIHGIHGGTEWDAELTTDHTDAAADLLTKLEPTP